MPTMRQLLPQMCTERFASYAASPEGAYIAPECAEPAPENSLWHHTVLGARALKKHTTTAWESKFFRSFLREILVEYGVGGEAPVVDLGCGDGRVTRLCREAGLRNVVGVDLDAANVRHAAAGVPADERDALIYMAADVNNLPFRPQSLTFALSSGIPFHERTFASLAPLFAPGGLLLYFSSSTFSSVLLYALVRGDWREFLRVAETGTRAAVWEEKDVRYKTETAAEIEAAAAANGFRPEKRSGIPVFASLIFGGLCQDQPDMDERDKDRLEACLDRLAATHREVVRQYLMLFRKQ